MRAQEDTGRSRNCIKRLLLRDQTMWPGLCRSFGAVGMKVGQHLALRPDIVTDDSVLQEFLEFTDQRKDHMAFGEVKRKLNGFSASPFAWVDPRPLGAASLAQVHRAELNNGEQVVVKLLRSDARDEIERNKKLIQRLAKLAGKAKHGEELSEWLDRELDYLQEVKNLQSFGEMLAYSQAVRVPKVYSELCDQDVITLEYLNGVPLSRVMEWVRTGRHVELRARSINRFELATNLVEAILEQVFSHRLFHADTHPGNLLALPGNVVGFIDFGLVDVLDARFGRGMFRYLHSIYHNDVDEMLLGLKGMLSPTKIADWEDFRDRFLEANRTWRRGGSNLERSPTGHYMLSVVRAASETGFTIPPGIMSMLRALMTADLIAYELGSEESLRETGRSFFAKHSLRELTGLMAPEKLQGELLNVLDMSRDGPKKAYRALNALVDEQLVIRIESTESAQTRRRANARAQLVTLAVIAVSISLILAARLTVPEPRGPIWVLAALLAAIYFSIVLVWRRLSQ